MVNWKSTTQRDDRETEQQSVRNYVHNISLYSVHWRCIIILRWNACIRWSHVFVAFQDWQRQPHLLKCETIKWYFKQSNNNNNNQLVFPLIAYQYSGKAFIVYLCRVYFVNVVNYKSYLTLSMFKFKWEFSSKSKYDKISILHDSTHNTNTRVNLLKHHFCFWLFQFTEKWIFWKEWKRDGNRISL